MSYLTAYLHLTLHQLSIYILSFVAHFYMLPYIGPGDAFHDAPYRCRLKVSICV